MLTIPFAARVGHSALPLLLAALFLLAGCAAPSHAPHVTYQKLTRGAPNIVIIFADDLGYGDLGCYGQTAWSTPNLDRLAFQGVRFTDFYVAQSVCSASRAALMTGRYPNRVGISGALGPRTQAGLNPEEVTIAEICAAAGYATAAFGKWHLGDSPAKLPTRQGFDTWCGIPCSNDMWPHHPDLAKLPPDAAARQAGYPPLPLYENERIINQEITAADQSRFTEDFTRRACAFIREHSDRQFLVYLAHPMPHVPLFPGAAFQGSSSSVYGDVIQELDWSVGQIMQCLDELNLTNTLVIFTSDNGPWLSYGNHAGTTAGLREGKGTSWEGGVRVPCIMRWPGKIAANTTCRTPAMTIDILPTIATLTQVTAPRTDGVTLSTLLTTGSDADLEQRPLAFYYNKNDFEAVRVGRWKLILPHSYRTLKGEPGRDGLPGPYVQARSGTELYDLSTDPRESMNVIDREPAVRDMLFAEVERIRADLGDALTNRPRVTR